MTTYRAPCPVDAEGALDQMHQDISDEFENGDEIADRLYAKAEPHKTRLDEMLTEAWMKFVDEIGLTEEHADTEED